MRAIPVVGTLVLVVGCGGGLGAWSLRQGPQGAGAPAVAGPPPRPPATVLGERSAEGGEAEAEAPLACPPEPRRDLPSPDERAGLREAESLVALIDRAARPLHPGERQRIAEAIVREARANDLDPKLVAAVIRVESAFDVYAVSPAGALGLMQLMPATGTWLARMREQPVRDATSLFNIERNIELGCAYLARMLRKFGRIDHALLAYNRGPNAARRLLADPRRAEAALAGYASRVLAERERLVGDPPLRTASRETRLEPRKP